MFKKIKIPKYLKYIHGDESDLLSILSIYFIGITSSFIFINLTNFNIPLNANIALFLIMFDVSAGVIANFTYSTNNYYKKNKKISFIFLSLHILHPILLTLIFPSEFLFFFSVGFYTLISSLLILNINDVNKQYLSASILLTIGILLSYFLLNKDTPIYLVGIFFMVKLILGFSVRR